MMNGTAEATGIQPVASADQLNSADFAGEAAIRVLPLQRGKGTEPDLARCPVGCSERRVEGPVQRQAHRRATNHPGRFARRRAGRVHTAGGDFFAKNLKKQPLNASVTTGFLEADDFATLWRHCLPIGDNLTPDQQMAARQANETQRQKSWSHWRRHSCRSCSSA